MLLNKQRNTGKVGFGSIFLTMSLRWMKFYKPPSCRRSDCGHTHTLSMRKPSSTLLLRCGRLLSKVTKSRKSRLLSLFSGCTFGWGAGRRVRSDRNVTKKQPCFTTPWVTIPSADLVILLMICAARREGINCYIIIIIIRLIASVFRTDCAAGFAIGSWQLLPSFFAGHFFAGRKNHRTGALALG